MASPKRKEKSLPPPPRQYSADDQLRPVMSNASIGITIPDGNGIGEGDMAESPIASTSQSRSSFDSAMSGGAMSPSSSSSSSSASFAWPAPNFASSSHPIPSFDPIREHADPFENPFDPRRYSASSDDFRSSRQDSFSDPIESTPTFPDPEEIRRGSVTMIPHHQPRAVTDPALFTGLPVDPELTIAPVEAFDFDSAYTEEHLAPPSFVRTFSAPLPNRVGFLRHPLSPASDPLNSYSAHPPRHAPVSTSFSALTVPRPGPLVSHSSDSTAVSNSETPVSDFLATPIQTLSVELADSLQSAIQTLLHLSPPHLLDNAKEQYSGCTVNLPTTSLSALLTSMKSLNYFSANIQSLMTMQTTEQGLLAAAVGKRREDFDIGELLQSVADLLSGQAAQAGVDLVLFHGDVEIKHINVNGDGEGLAYLLSHIIRQILVVAKKGDTIELGLQIIPQSPSFTPRVALPMTAAAVDQERETKRPSSPGGTLSTPPSGQEGPLLCIFEIVHNVQVDYEMTTPKAELNPFTKLDEQRQASTPRLDTILCRRLLQHQNASLKIGSKPSSPADSGPPRPSYELTVLLPRGNPMVEPAPLTTEEEAMRQPFPRLKLAREPTLPELANFAESLRGKRVILHASLTSVFARHLTSYLGAWGMDVSHMPMEEVDEVPDRSSLASSPKISVSPVTSALSAMNLDPGTAGSKFIIIDDDVTVLKRELMRLRNEISLTLKPRLTKRPTLSSRTKSSPLIRQPAPKPSTVIIHFTSIAKYNHVRDVISSYLGTPGSTPEVMVIPKPVGPRRFLTALHTAVHQPLVDPYFSPIATSPRSPGGGFFSGPAHTPSGLEFAREGFFDAIPEGDSTNLETGSTGAGSGKARSPMGDYPPKHISMPTPADMLSTPASEYFSNAVRGTNSSGSAVVMQSPDGRPVGMFFEPPSKNERRASSNRLTREGRKVPSRKTSVVEQAESTTPQHGSPQDSRRSSAAGEDKNQSRRSSTKSSTSDPPARKPKTARRGTMPNPPNEAPIIAKGRERSGTVTRDGTIKRKPPTPVVTTPPAVVEGPSAPERGAPMFFAPKPNKKAAVMELDDMHRLPITPAAKKVPLEENVVPPINVLIVEDNPINQNILSMFLRKKKIKHQSAKDGLEAVEKWKTGGFHLILVPCHFKENMLINQMDIQLPVMDGISATKEIRNLEKSNNIGIFPSTPMSEQPHPLVTSMSGTSTPLEPSALQGAAAASITAAKTPLKSNVIIVALTASSLQTDRTTALAAGCNDFLTKPVSLKWLERKIVEWGCMQALIDFDGWRRWKSADPKEGKDSKDSASETKRGFQTGPQAKAKSLAENLRLNPDRKLRTPLSKPLVQDQPDITFQAATPPPLDDSAGPPLPPKPESPLPPITADDTIVAMMTDDEKARAAEDLEHARSELLESAHIDVRLPTDKPVAHEAVIESPVPAPVVTRHTSSPVSKGGTPELGIIAEAKESPLRKTVELLEQQAEIADGQESSGNLVPASSLAVAPVGGAVAGGIPPALPRKVSGEKPLPAIPLP